jgi:ubiquinone/menaquinone biosynthesis C-methylase UbiE
MSELSNLDPTGRFSGLADIYARCRPDYPTAAIDFVLERCGLKPGDLVVDVGCGTGISTRLLARRGLRVIGIEPNADMRERARNETPPRDGPAPEYREGAAEATGLPDHGADAVVSAQAFHWFDAPRALAEFARILKPSGWVALLWNERDTSDPFTRDYGAVVRAFKQAVHVEDTRQRSGQAFLTSPLFERQTLNDFSHEQVVTEEEMIGRALSASYAPRESHERAQLESGLRRVFAAYSEQAKAVLRYRTSVYLGRARNGPK